MGLGLCESVQKSLDQQRRVVGVMLKTKGGPRDRGTLCGGRLNSCYQDLNNVGGLGMRECLGGHNPSE